MIHKTKNAIKKVVSFNIVRYLISGATGFLVDTVVLYLITLAFFEGNNSVVLGLLSVNKMISATAGSFAVFILSRFWVFADGKNSKAHVQGIKYTLFTIFNLFFASLLYSFFKNLLDTAFGYNSIGLPNILTEGTKMVTSYFVYKFIIFK